MITHHSRGDFDGSCKNQATPIGTGNLSPRIFQTSPGGPFWRPKPSQYILAEVAPVFVSQVAVTSRRIRSGEIEGRSEPGWTSAQLWKMPG